MASGIFCAAAEDGFSRARSFCGATQLITCMPYYSVKLSSFTLDPRKSPDAGELLLAWTKSYSNLCMLTMRYGPLESSPTAAC